MFIVIALHRKIRHGFLAAVAQGPESIDKTTASDYSGT
jgi:hypothetical protein